LSSIIQITQMSLAATRAPLGAAPDIAVPWLRIVLALAFCLVVAFAAILVIRRRQGGSGDLRTLLNAVIRTPDETAIALRIDERIRLSASSQIVVLRWEGDRYLVHVAPSGAQLLDRRSSQIDADPS
jgi:hypothetical protein